MFNEATKAIGIIDLNSLIPAYQIAMNNDALSNP